MSGSSHRTGIRRDVLRVMGGGAVAALAGCLGGTDPENDSTGETDVAPEQVAVEQRTTWRTTPLEDVTTGTQFRVEAFDRPVIVHMFARGCAACHSQQREFDKLYSENDIEIVDLTIDPNERAPSVQEYAETDDFDWRFGISPEAVTGDLVDDFGEEVTTSAASPVIIVCPSGETYRLDKVVDAGALETAIEDVC